MPTVAILDDFFPQPLSAFRFEEFRGYLDVLPDVHVHTSGATMRWAGEERAVEAVIAAHVAAFPTHKGRIHVLSPAAFPEADAYYTVFLHNIFQHLEAVEKRGKPFAFTLYPGGGFSLDQPKADSQMARVFASPCFRRVIVTQPIVRDYVLAKHWCGEEQILYVQGGVIPRAAFAAPAPKPRFGLDKTELDLCFVANRYTPTGADKGYDLFVGTAQRLRAAGVDARFHVVGPYDPSVLDLGSAADRFRFYGFRPTEFFAEFYRGMDAILAPTRPFVLQAGKIDGFPTGAAVEAGLQEVGILCTDELKLNTSLEEGDEIVIVRPEVDDIVARLSELIRAPTRLASIGESGRRALLRLFSADVQITPRLALLRALPRL